MLKKLILSSFCLLSLLLGCESGVGRYVDPNIGGVAPLLTTVVPQVVLQVLLRHILQIAGVIDDGGVPGIVLDQAQDIGKVVLVSSEYKNPFAIFGVYGCDFIF